MKRVLIVLAIMAMPVLAFRLWWGPTYSYRYKLTVEVETPTGIRSSSSVIAIRHTPGPERFLGIQGSAPPRQQGEAVFVDLGEGRHVVMLLPDTGKAFRAFKLDQTHEYRQERVHLHDLVSRLPLGSKVALKAPEIPTMVTFADHTDPASFKIVYQTNRSPAGLSFCSDNDVVLVDNFVSLFGSGYAFKAATLEIVSNRTAVTQEIQKQLPDITRKTYEHTRRSGGGEMPNAPFYVKYEHLKQEF